MDNQRPSTPSPLTTNVDDQPSQYHHMADVAKVNNCAQELTAAINQLLEKTKWDLECAESEKAEVEARYEGLEDEIMEKDEEIEQNQIALQLAAEENTKLKQGRELAMSLVNEIQRNADISEEWSNKKVENALQSEAALRSQVQKLLEEKNTAVNARDAAESRAENSEKARKEAETRTEQAEQVKILAEERAKQLESKQAYLNLSRQQAETRAEKAEADLTAAVKRENEVRRLLQVATSMPPKKRPTNLNKRSRPSSSTAKKRREFCDLESTYHDKRLKELAQDLNRVVDGWGTEKERHILFRFTIDAITVTRVRKGRDACESSLCVRCVRYAKEAVITVFSVVSLARTIYGADIDSKAAAELLRAYISQTVSRRHAQNLDVSEETERVTIFRWANLVDILNEVAKVYHKPDLAAAIV